MKFYLNAETSKGSKKPTRHTLASYTVPVLAEVQHA